MPWLIVRPSPQWQDLEKLRFSQEVYDRHRFGSFQWTPPLVAANSSVSFVLSSIGPDIISTIATGLRPSNPVVFSPPSALPAQISLYGMVTSSDKATIVIVNPTAGGITPPAGKWGMMGMVT
jgi:hypothetical protein